MASGKARAFLDGLLFATGLGCAAALLYYEAVLPNARRAERLERRGYALAHEVDVTAGAVERLRAEVTALQSDPYTIERTLKRRMQKLRPDLCVPAELVEKPVERPAATPAAPRARPR